MEIRPLKAMINHHATEVFMDEVAIPASSLVGVEGNGFKLDPRRHERRADPRLG